MKPVIDFFKKNNTRLHMLAAGVVVSVLLISSMFTDNRDVLTLISMGLLIGFIGFVMVLERYRPGM